MQYCRCNNKHCPECRYLHIENTMPRKPALQKVAKKPVQRKLQVSKKVEIAEAIPPVKELVPELHLGVQLALGSWSQVHGLRDSTSMVARVNCRSPNEVCARWIKLGEMGFQVPFVDAIHLKARAVGAELSLSNVMIMEQFVASTEGGHLGTTKLVDVLSERTLDDIRKMGELARQNYVTFTKTHFYIRADGTPAVAATGEIYFDQGTYNSYGKRNFERIINVVQNGIWYIQALKDHGKVLDPTLSDGRFWQQANSHGAKFGEYNEYRSMALLGIPTIPKFVDREVEELWW